MSKTMLLLLVLFASGPAIAAENLPALLAARRCNACHDAKAALIGPPYVAIAARHRGSGDEAVEVLARKILLGGGGSWGLVPMVPNEHVTLAEARAMARWILEVQP
jgi:cytochrome c551/c552